MRENPCFVAGTVGGDVARPLARRQPKADELGGARCRSPRRRCARSPSRRQARLLLRAEVTSTPTVFDADGFDRALKSNALRLCFVGMSNCGKSHRSRQLSRESGFQLMCVDDHIERRIEPELRALGFYGISGLAQWMGFPHDERFAANEQRYLQLERDVTASVKPPPGANFALDTTGSVVYLPASLHTVLRSNFLVVHLEASDAMLDAMVDNYFATPKPVVWGDAYRRMPGEDVELALRRCYPRLLSTRRQRYSALAHVTVPGEVSLSPNIGAADFMDEIRRRLSS